MTTLPDASLLLSSEKLKERIVSRLEIEFGIGKTVANTLIDTIILIVEDMITVLKNYPTYLLDLVAVINSKTITTDEFYRDIYNSMMDQVETNAKYAPLARAAAHGLRLKEFITQHPVAIREDFGREIKLVKDIVGCKSMTDALKIVQQSVSIGTTSILDELQINAKEHQADPTSFLMRRQILSYMSTLQY
jgi:hypothetical protein